MVRSFVPEADKTLDDLRAEIDTVDDQILELLSKRFSITEEVGQYKATHDLPAEDKTREAKQYKRMKKLARELYLPEGIEKAVFEVVMGYSKQRHTEIKRIIS
jgi:chorismate mutase